MWRKSSEAPAKPESPSAATLESLFKSKGDGEFIMNPKFFGHVLTVTGTLREFVTDERGERRQGQKDGHFGLDGIAERIERMEGSFEISSTPGKGTCAEIKLPPGQKP